MLVTEQHKIGPKHGSLNIGGKLLSLQIPLVMGILNITPDSFFDGGEYTKDIEIRERVSKMIAEGADIIDIGGYSTRPGASQIEERDELERVKQGVKVVREIDSTIPISIDTFRPTVVEEIYNQFGSFIVNDISGGGRDGEMFRTVTSLKLPYILMHIQGEPHTMQNNISYTNVTTDVIKSLAVKADILKQLGATDIIIDPGFGFGKDTEHNFTLLNNLDNFHLLDLPILSGVSRKSMIWKSLDITPSESLNGTTALNMVSLIQGASILRVHDVKEARETVTLFTKLQTKQEK